jgi:hypothetical protein
MMEESMTDKVSLATPEDEPEVFALADVIYKVLVGYNAHQAMDALTLVLAQLAEQQADPMRAQAVIAEVLRANVVKDNGGP